MVRTDSKGMRIAEELIGGARREGRKSLRYHYDNPAIEGDEDSGSPKLGYAVSFPVPNTDQRGVIGSGIYLDPKGSSQCAPPGPGGAYAATARRLACARS